MAKEVLIKSGTPIVWANLADYSSSGSGYTRTHQLDLTSLVAGGAREGAKADLGATHARVYACHLGIEFDDFPDACQPVELWWSESASATAGTGNTGGASGADGNYKTTEVPEWKQQLRRIGTLPATNDDAGTIQRAFVGFLIPTQRYGMPIVVNATGDDFFSDAVEMYVALVPLINEVQ